MVDAAGVVASAADDVEADVLGAAGDVDGAAGDVDGAAEVVGGVYLQTVR